MYMYMYIYICICICIYIYTYIYIHSHVTYTSPRLSFLKEPFVARHPPNNTFVRSHLPSAPLACSLPTSGSRCFSRMLSVFMSLPPCLPLSPLRYPGYSSCLHAQGDSNIENNNRLYGDATEESNQNKTNPVCCTVLQHCNALQCLAVCCGLCKQNKTISNESKQTV